jgi:HEAT repeat protein
MRIKNKFIVLGLSLPLLAFTQLTEAEWVRRVQSHLLIDDTASALSEANALAKEFPDSRLSGSTLIIALSASGHEDKALGAWHQLSAKYPDLSTDRHVLEELSWGVLKKGLASTQYGVRLASLIGSFLTNDVRALPILLKMMRDSNAVVRSVAVQMASQYRDAPLKDEIARMMQEEKVWMVRLEVIKTCGAFRMKEMAPQLKSLIQSDKTTYEERLRAIEALCGIYDQISFPEWLVFARSNRAGLRHLACNVAAHFELKEAKEDILRLIHDSHPDVRIAALNAFGLYYRKITPLDEIKDRLKSVLEDPTPEVAITAAWASLISGLEAEEVFAKWLNDSISEHRRLAAAALSATGEKGTALSAQYLKESTDMYVKANLAMGLLGQKKELASCCDILYEFLQSEKRMWMWDTRPNPLFQVLAPSQVRHVDHIPNYPEAIDQMTRLNLLSLLTLAEDPRAIVAIKSFLKKKTWGITGVAAATLLQEGDETSLEVVRQLLNDPDPDVRLQACFVMAMLGREESVIRDLQGAYVTADHERKLHILEAMGRVGNVESFHFLISAFNEPFPILRIAAAAALIQSIHR